MKSEAYYTAVRECNVARKQANTLRARLTKLEDADDAQETQDEQLAIQTEIRVLELKASEAAKMMSSLSDTSTKGA